MCFELPGQLATSPGHLQASSMTSSRSLLSQSSGRTCKGEWFVDCLPLADLVGTRSTWREQAATDERTVLLLLPTPGLLSLGCLLPFHLACACLAVSLPKLKAFDWRIDVKTASDQMARMNMPTALIHLAVRQPCGQATSLAVDLTCITGARQQQWVW